MPDIAMCCSTKCPRRLECYRYTAKPDKYMQSYAYFDPQDCEYFMPIYGSKKPVKKEAK